MFITTSVGKVHISNTKPLTKVVFTEQVMPTLETIEITPQTSERIDELFDEAMDEYISESGMRDDYGFEEDRYLESFTHDEKINKIITTLETELACYKLLVKHYQSN